MFSNRIRSDASKNTGIVRFGSVADLFPDITPTAALTDSGHSSHRNNSSAASF
jgi:hypothetical protein